MPAWQPCHHSPKSLGLWLCVISFRMPCPFQADVSSKTNRTQDKKMSKSIMGDLFGFTIVNGGRTRLS
jgi:hypothetical protein